jgi:polyisoprenoid-binding protein YceI
MTLRLRDTPIMLAALLCASAAAQPVSYRLDPAHSFVHFEVMHFRTSTIRGRFGPLQGIVTMDRSAGRGEIGVAIDTTTLDTGLKVFDARLRESDLLATDAHPQAWFVARRFRFDGGQLKEVRGEFTLRGVSQPLSLIATRFGCHEHPQLKREVCGGDFVGQLTRSEFGMTLGLPFVADRVRLVLQVEGIRE